MSVKFFIVLLLSAGLSAAVYLVQIPQNLQKRAAEPVCPANSASCSWDLSPGADNYYVEVTDLTQGKVTAKGTTRLNTVFFTATFGHEYECKVEARNGCGSAPATAGQSSVCANLAPTQSGPTVQPTQTAALPSGVTTKKETGQTFFEGNAEAMDRPDARMTPYATPAEPQPAEQEHVSALNGAAGLTWIIAAVNLIIFLGVIIYWLYSKKKKHEPKNK